MPLIKLLKQKKANKYFYIIIGFLSGILNGFFGSGGGMITVPLLKMTSLEEKKAHATSISIILPLTLFSLFLYFSSNNINFKDSYYYTLIIPSIIGAICGSLFLKKIPNIWLKRIFGSFILFAAFKMLFF